MSRRADDGSGAVRTAYLGGLVYTYRLGETHCRVHVLGIRMYSRAYLRCKLLVFRWSRVRRWLQWLDAQISPEYDDIYLFRHHIGETCVELMHIAERVAAKGSKKPLVVARNAVYKELSDMYLPAGMDACCIPMHVGEVFDAFGEGDKRAEGDVEVRFGRRRYICSTPRVVQAMRRLLADEPELHFYTYITRSLSIPRSAPCAWPRVPSGALPAAERRLRELGLSKEGYVLLAPEAATMQTMPPGFWQQLADALREGGCAVLVNAAPEAKVCPAGAVSIYPAPGELYALAQMARGVICMGSGLAVLLACAGVRMDVLFTPFADEAHGYDAEQAQRVYSMARLPHAHPDLHEYNAAQMPQHELLREILARYGIAL